MSNKYFYEFHVNKEIEIEDQVINKNEDGSETITKRKVKKETPVKFLLRKPNRVLRDDADLYYNMKLAEATRKGMLTASGLSKIIDNEDGVLSEKDKELKSETYAKLLNKQSEYQRLGSKADKTDDDKLQIEAIEKEISEALVILKSIEKKESHLYANTAEMYAQTKTLFWWMLNLSYYHDEADKIVAFFGEGDEKKKMAKYDEYEEKEDLFLIEVINKLSHYTAVAFITSSFDQEKMDAAIKAINKIDVS